MTIIEKYNALQLELNMVDTIIILNYGPELRLSTLIKLGGLRLQPHSPTLSYARELV